MKQFASLKKKIVQSISFFLGDHKALFIFHVKPLLDNSHKNDLPYFTSNKEPRGAWWLSGRVLDLRSDGR